MRRDTRTAIDKYVDKFWMQEILNKETEDSKLSLMEVDEIVHELIHRMLQMSEDDQSQIHQVHLQQHMMHH